MFVTSPPTGVKTVRRSPTSTESSPDYTLSTAVFDSVRVTGADGEPVTGSWQHLDTNGPPRELPHDNVAGSFTEDAGTVHRVGCRRPRGRSRPAPAGTTTWCETASAASSSGSSRWRSSPRCSSPPSSAAASSVRRSPRPRVAGGCSPPRPSSSPRVAFVTGVAAAVPAFLISQPLLRENGFAPPAYPKVSLTDGPVARAVVGTGLVLALLAVLALALGALLRSSAAAITVVIALVVLPVHHRALPDPRRRGVAQAGHAGGRDGDPADARTLGRRHRSLARPRRSCAGGSPWPWWPPSSSFVGGTRERGDPGAARRVDQGCARSGPPAGCSLGVTALTLGLGALVACERPVRRLRSAGRRVRRGRRRGSRSPGCTSGRSPPSCSGCWSCRRSTPPGRSGRRWPPSLDGG